MNNDLTKTEKAILWWRVTPFEWKWNEIIKNKEFIKGYPDRDPDTLTNREIEILYDIKYPVKQDIWKEVDVVMIQSDKKPIKDDIVLNTPNNNLYIMARREHHSNYDTIHVKGSTFYEWDRAMLCQHLYLLSDDEIKEGDWYCFLLHKGGYNIKQYISEQHFNESSCISLANLKAKKIIATTDTELKFNLITGMEIDKNWKEILKSELPRPSDEFIQFYIHEYNTENKIEKVRVEYINPFVAGSYMNTCITCEKLFIGHRLWSQCPDHPFIKVDDNNTITIKL